MEDQKYWKNQFEIEDDLPTNQNNSRLALTKSQITHDEEKNKSDTFPTIHISMNRGTKIDNEKRKSPPK